MVNDSKKIDGFGFAEIEQNELSNKEIQSFLKKNNTSVPHFPFFVKYDNENGTKTPTTIIENLEDLNIKEEVDKTESSNLKLLKAKSRKKSKTKKKHSAKKHKYKTISGKKFLELLKKK